MLKRINQIFWFIIKRLGDLRFAIVLLLGIAVFSALGTVIEQNKDPSFYEINYDNNKPVLGFITASLILNLGLDNVYQTWWFVLIILLFGATSISSTCGLILFIL